MVARQGLLREGAGGRWVSVAVVAHGRFHPVAVRTDPDPVAREPILDALHPRARACDRLGGASGLCPAGERGKSRFKPNNGFSINQLSLALPALNVGDLKCPRFTH
jgi:hypothetical protein